MGLLSVSASDDNAMGATGVVGTNEGARLIGMGMGGSSPRSVWQSVAVACSLLGGASWTPAMASVSCCVVDMILSMGVMTGTGMA